MPLLEWQVGREGQRLWDFRQNELATGGNETFQPLDFRFIHPAAHHLFDKRRKLILRKNGFCLPLQLGEIARHERRVFEETGHLIRLGQVPAGLRWLCGPEKSSRGAPCCVAPAKNGVEVVRNKDMPVCVQVFEMDEVIPDSVGQSGFPVVEKRVDSKKAQPVVDIQRCRDRCDKLLLRGFGQELAKLDQVPPVILGGVGFLEINLPIRFGILSQVGKVGLHAPRSHRAVNVHWAQVVETCKVAADHIVICIGAVHGISGHGGVCAIEPDTNQARP